MTKLVRYGKEHVYLHLSTMTGNPNVFPSFIILPPMPLDGHFAILLAILSIGGMILPWFPLARIDLSSTLASMFGATFHSAISASCHFLESVHLSSTIQS